MSLLCRSATAREWSLPAGWLPALIAFSPAGAKWLKVASERTERHELPVQRNRIFIVTIEKELNGGGTDRLDFALDGILLQHVQRQANENVHARHNLPEDAAEHRTFFFDATDKRRSRIFKAPVRRHRMAGPVRTDLAGGVVAHGDDEIHMWRVRCAEFVPALAAQLIDRIPASSGKTIRHRLNRVATGRPTTRCGLLPWYGCEVNHEH